MASIETFLTTPEAVAVPRAAAAEVASHDVSVVSIAQVDALLADWRALSAEAIEDNPFLSPSFLTPAISHEAAPLSISLAAVWRKMEGIRKLVGLFPLRPVRRELAFRWPIASRAELWRHPLQPMGTPLLAGDADVAGETIAAFLSWLSARRPRLAGLHASALPIDGIASRILVAEAERRLLSVRRTPDAAHSHGFHLPSTLPLADLNDVKVLKAPRDVRAATESFLCLEARTSAARNRDALIATPRDAAFLRGVARSLALENRLAVALYEKEGRSAAALFVEGRDQIFLWQMVGPAEFAPAIEAALPAAVGLAVGKPVVAATVKPVTGFWTLPLLTATLEIGLTPSPAALAQRLGRRISALGII